MKSWGNRAIGVGLVCLLGACVTTTIPVVWQYEARTLAEVYMSTDVEPFAYTPPEGMDQRQFRQDFLTIQLDQPVPLFFADAVKRELVLAGSEVSSSAPCILTGTVEKLALEAPNGFVSPHAVVAVSYTLSVASKDERLFHARIENEPEVEGVLAAMHRNIDALLNRGDFASVAEQHCGKPA